MKRKAQTRLTLRSETVRSLSDLRLVRGGGDGALAVEQLAGDSGDFRCPGLAAIAPPRDLG